MQRLVKNLFNHLDKFALEFGVITKCYSSLVKTESIPDTQKKPFTDEEVDKIWEIKEQAWVDSILVFLYSGFRISEVLALTWQDINWEEGTVSVNKTITYVKDSDDPDDKWHNVVGPPKTKSSNRKIPLFPAVIELLNDIKMTQDSNKSIEVTALCNIRRAKCISGYELAEKIGIPQATYALYERGSLRVEMSIIKALAEALGCDISELLMVNNNPYGSTYRQGALRCTLRTEKRKYKPMTENEPDTVTVMKNKRKFRGYTVKELADITGIVDETLYSFEYGSNKPDITSLEKIAVALNCKVDDLVIPNKSEYTIGEYKGTERYELRKEPIKFYDDNNLIFCTDTGVLRLSKDMRKRFGEIAKKADISGISIHSLRHTFATRGLEQGIPLKVMQELLGHSSIKMTADLYTHVLPEIKHNEVMKLTDAIQF